MKIDILTLFPKMFEGPLGESIVKRAQDKKLLELNIYDLRDWATDKHGTIDDKPYGGGPGMVMRVDVVDTALKSLKASSKKVKVILLSPQGKTLDQKKAKDLSGEKHLILVSGHYEGFDHRIREHLADEELSIGNFVLTGGELPAMIVTDTVARLIPGVLGDKESLAYETHTEKGHKKYPVYTRPEKYKDWEVPSVLLSGDHKKILEWQNREIKKINN